jgi:hypothetical protein
MRFHHSISCLHVKPINHIPSLQEVSLLYPKDTSSGQMLEQMENKVNLSIHHHQYNHIE